MHSNYITCHNTHSRQVNNPVSLPENGWSCILMNNVVMLNHLSPSVLHYQLQILLVAMQNSSSSLCFLKLVSHVLPLQEKSLLELIDCWVTPQCFMKTFALFCVSILNWLNSFGMAPHTMYCHLQNIMCWCCDDVNGGKKIIWLHAPFSELLTGKSVFTNAHWTLFKPSRGVVTRLQNSVNIGHGHNDRRTDFFFFFLS